MQPVTYPARPCQGGPLDLAFKAGLYSNTDVWFEPKYNGWRGMVHTPSGTLLSRHGEPMNGEVTREFRAALDSLRECPFEWLDVEALERRHQIGRGTFIVLDWIVREPLTYTQRRTLLETQFDRFAAVGMEIFTEPGEVRLCPSHDFGLALRLWDQLQAINAQLGCVYYEGVVAKLAGSTYPIQLRNSAEEYRPWTKHRFTTK